MKRSGTIGVRYRSDSGKWRASIGIENKKIDLGCFVYERDAIKARKEAEVKYNRTDKSRESYIEEGIGYIALTKGKFALVDLECFDEICKYKWYAYFNTHTKSFYAVRSTVDNNMRDKTIRMHDLIMNPTGDCIVDHIDHNTLDNRKLSLRIVTKSQNQMNCRMYKNNKSGIIGVYWHKLSMKWRAQIVVNKKPMHLGLFTNIKDASKARKKAEGKYFGEYAYNSNLSQNEKGN